jgi:hypothetical protein
MNAIQEERVFIKSVLMYIGYTGAGREPVYGLSEKQNYTQTFPIGRYEDQTRTKGLASQYRN